MIAEALYKSTFLESWGSGAKRIMDACKEQGIDEPSWRCEGGFVLVTFKRPSYELNDVAQNDGDVAQNDGDVAQNDGDVAQNDGDVAQNMDKAIIRIIKSNLSITREEIANLLSVNKKTIERHLKDIGIKWEGHPKTGHWNIPSHLSDI
jgi:ATP-dependent DNA helicase RecG